LGAMVIVRNETRLCVLERFRAFLEGMGEVRFQSVGDDEGRYTHSKWCLSASLILGSRKGRMLRYRGRHGLSTTAVLTRQGGASA
jgi:hypothetical protein